MDRPIGDTNKFIKKLPQALITIFLKTCMSKNVLTPFCVGIWSCFQKRNWFSCSEKYGTVYCHNCWLFARNYIGEQSYSMGSWVFPKHKSSEAANWNAYAKALRMKFEATKTLAQLKEGKWVNIPNEAGIAMAKNVWREDLHRIIAIISTLAILCLSLPGHKVVVGVGRC